MSDAAGDEQQVDLVFASRVVLDADESIVSSQVIGEIDLDQRDRIARPYQREFLVEPQVYAEEAWVRVDEGGNKVRGYAVWSYPNDAAEDFAAPVPSSDLTVVNDNVLEFLADLPDDGSADLLNLDFKLRGFPEWNVPLPPDAMQLAPADIEVGALRRADAISDRQDLMEEMSAPLVADILAAGGVVHALRWNSGWIQASVPSEAFATFADHPDIARIDGPYGKALRQMTGTPGFIGGMKELPFSGAVHFSNNGWDGAQANSSRHSYGAITFGITEFLGYENYACAFRGGKGCNSASRIINTVRCDAASPPYCEIGGAVDLNVLDPLGNWQENHGTMVTSAAIANYMAGQGNGKRQRSGRSRLGIEHLHSQLPLQRSAL